MGKHKVQIERQVIYWQGGKPRWWFVLLFFTLSPRKNDEVIPEWTSKNYIELELGAKLHRVVDGKDVVIGIFNGREFISED